MRRLSLAAKDGSGAEAGKAEAAARPLGFRAELLFIQMFHSAIHAQAEPGR